MYEAQTEQMQMEMEQLKNQIEELTAANPRTQRHCLIAVIVTFLIIVTGIAAFSLYHFVTDNQKIETYRVETDSKYEEYEQFLNSLNN